MLVFAALTMHQNGEDGSDQVFKLVKGASKQSISYASLDATKVEETRRQFPGGCSGAARYVACRLPQLRPTAGVAVGFVTPAMCHYRGSGPGDVP